MVSAWYTGRLRLRSFLIDWPARIVEVAWTSYLVLVAAASILCLTTVALMLAADHLGFRLFW